jgi:urease accessory protein
MVAVRRTVKGMATTTVTVTVTVTTTVTTTGTDLATTTTGTDTGTDTDTDTPRAMDTTPLPIRATTTPGAMDTVTDGALLRLIWLASPALPVGGFSYSEGLEAAIDAGRVTDEATASEWIVHQLHLALARSDLPVLAQAVVAARNDDAETLAILDDWVLQTRETSELRQQTVQMGRSLGEWQKSLGAAAPPARTYPVAFAVAAAGTDATPRQVLLAFAFGWSENMMQAAIKSVPLGQGAGQRILLGLAGEIPAAVDHALSLGNDRRQSFTPMLAVLSARHETQYSRLFRS